MINCKCPVFPDLNNFCNKHLYTKLLSQFNDVYSYGSGNKNRQTKLLKTTVHKNFIFVGLFRIPL